MRTMLAAFAQYEGPLIRARTRAAVADKRGRLDHTGGPRPFGFRPVPANTGQGVEDLVFDVVTTSESLRLLSGDIVVSAALVVPASAP